MIGETDYIIPLMVVPPINNEVWHNFIENEDLKSQKRTDLEAIIRIGSKKQVSPSYRNNMVKAAKSEYALIKERAKMIKFDIDFLNKWHSILDVSKSMEILKNSKDNEKLERNMDNVREEVNIL